MTNPFLSRVLLIVNQTRQYKPLFSVTRNTTVVFFRFCAFVFVNDLKLENEKLVGVVQIKKNN